MATQRQLDREIGGSDDEARRRLRAIRADVRHEAARRELEELKQGLRPQVAPRSERAEDVSAAVAASGRAASPATS
jgi:hypothetical protein